jgi:hypothetical protein
MAIFNGYVKLPEGTYLSWSSSILPHGHIKNPHFRWEQQQVAARSPYVVSWNPVNITMLAVRAKNLAWIYDNPNRSLGGFIFPQKLGDILHRNPGMNQKQRW